MGSIPNETEFPLRLLLLEDSESDAELLLRHLRRDGFAPETEIVASEGEYRQALGRDFDLILADYQLRDFDAPKALAILRESGIDLPFIVVTGRVGEEAAVECMRLGANDYLLKDRLARLGEAVRSVLEEREQRRIALEALHHEVTFSEAVIGTLPGTFYLLDEQMGLRRWNDNLERITGYRGSELAGMSAFDFIAPEDREGLRQRVEEILESGRGVALARLMTRDGQQIPYVFTAGVLETEEGVAVIGTGIDVSQQIEAEKRVVELNRELEKRLARLSALHEIDVAITGSVDLNLMMGVVLDRVALELGASASSVWLYEAKNVSLRRFISKGVAPGYGQNEVRLGDGQVGRCGLDRLTIHISGRERLLEAAPEVAGADVEEYVAVPLVAKGQLKGVLEVFRDSKGGLDDDWFEFLEALSFQAAIAVDNVMLFRELEHTATNLAKAYDDTIEGWARALDLRDHETEGHSRRVTELAVELARRMGMEESELAHLRRGALLHDIGKLGVPDAVLTKPGPLTSEERRVMEQHPVLAFELLSPIGFLRPAVDIPYCHHEAWDGSGYPRGLKGEEIPLAARIFAVADVYDALVSNRPYRSAWRQAEAVSYIAERAGKQFDERVVQVFLEIHSELKR